MSTTYITTDLAVAPVIWTPSEGQEVRLLLGPDAPKLALERHVQTMYSELANRRSTLPVATQVSLLEHRVLVVFTVDTRARDPKGKGRLGFRLAMGFWIDASVVPGTDAPVSRAFGILMAWIAGLVANGEFTDMVATSFVELCFQDGYARNILPRERVDALLQELETQFGLAGQASPASRADRNKGRRMAKRLRGEIYFWPSIMKATEFLASADDLLAPRTRGQARARLLAHHLRGWIQLAVLATLLALVAFVRLWLPPRSNIVVNALIALLSFVGEMLVVVMMKVSAPPQSRGWSTANLARLDAATSGSKLPPQVWALASVRPRLGFHNHICVGDPVIS